MPLQHFISKEHKVCGVKLHGTVTVHDLEGAARAIFEHPDFAPAFHTVWDCRHVKALLLSLDELKRFVALIQTQPRRRGPGQPRGPGSRAPLHIPFPW